jgi:hypothetical protein
MTEIIKKDISLNWVCRILFSIDILLLISGNLSYIQTRKQLVSPLIPDSLVTTIIKDSRFYESSIGAGVFLLAGLWFYSFNRKKTAVILFGTAILVYKLLPYLY